MREIQLIDFLRYYVEWNDYEKIIYENINKQTPNSLEQLKKYLIRMKIKRNFINSKVNPKLESQILSIVNKLSEIKTSSVTELSKILYKKNLLAKGRENAIVAASKILWLFNRDKIIIMDSLNQKSLSKLSSKKIRYNDYETFCKIWEEEYKKIKPLILGLITKNNLTKLDSIFSKEWFLRRCFDLYLTNLK